MNILAKQMDVVENLGTVYSSKKYLTVKGAHTVCVRTRKKIFTTNSIILRTV